MIILTRLDGKAIVVNADHILTVERTPDTLLQLTGGLHLMVKEEIEEVIDRVINYRRRILAGPEVDGTVLPFPRAMAPKE